MSLPIKTSCLDDAIGLSRTDCECFDVPTNISLSGLYIDELPGMDLRMAEATADCSQGTLWDFLKKAREQAILAFKSEYAIELSKQWKQSRISFKGQIGKAKADKDYTIGNYAGMRFIFYPIKNGVWKITRIGAIFASTGTIEVNLYNNVDADPIATYTVPTVQNTITWFNLPTPLYLPMQNDQCEYLQYFFLYAKNGFNPRDNDFNCGSCENYTLQFNCHTPISNKPTNNANKQFINWCNVTGVTGSTEAAIIEASPGFSNHAMGLVIDGTMQCESQSIVCNDTDFEHSDIANVMAHALWYRAGMYLCDAILSSSNVNRYTMLDRERLYAKKNSYKREYDDRRLWLSSPDTSQVRAFLLQTGCLECIKRISFNSML